MGISGDKRSGSDLIVTDMHYPLAKGEKENEM